MGKQFNYQNLPVRTSTDENEEIWFAGVDVCNILDYTNPTQAIEKLDEDERKLDSVKHGSGQLRKTWTINEFGLYSLIITSRKPEAKQFKRWITHEVLPAIRKAGKYTTEGAQQKEADIQEHIKNIDKIETSISNTQSELKDLKKKLTIKQTELIQILKSNPNQLKLNL